MFKNITPYHFVDGEGNPVLYVDGDGAPQPIDLRAIHISRIALAIYENASSLASDEIDVVIEWLRQYKQA